MAYKNTNTTKPLLISNLHRLLYFLWCCFILINFYSDIMNKKTYIADTQVCSSACLPFSLRGFTWLRLVAILSHTSALDIGILGNKVRISTHLHPGYCCANIRSCFIEISSRWVIYSFIYFLFIYISGKCHHTIAKEDKVH